MMLLRIDTLSNPGIPVSLIPGIVLRVARNTQHRANTPGNMLRATLLRA